MLASLFSKSVLEVVKKINTISLGRLLAEVVGAEGLEEVTFRMLSEERHKEKIELLFSQVKDSHGAKGVLKTLGYDLDFIKNNEFFFKALKTPEQIHYRSAIVRYGGEKKEATIYYREKNAVLILAKINKEFVEIKRDDIKAEGILLQLEEAETALIKQARKTTESALEKFSNLFSEEQKTGYVSLNDIGGDPSNLPSGLHGKLKGLKSEEGKKLNDMEVVVGKYDPSKRRFEVTLKGREGDVKKSIKIKCISVLKSDLLKINKESAAGLQSEPEPGPGSKAFKITQ